MAGTPASGNIQPLPWRPSMAPYFFFFFAAGFFLAADFFFAAFLAGLDREDFFFIGLGQSGSGRDCTPVDNRCNQIFADCAVGPANDCIRLAGRRTSCYTSAVVRAFPRSWTPIGGHPPLDRSPKVADPMPNRMQSEPRASAFALVAHHHEQRERHPAGAAVGIDDAARCVVGAAAGRVHFARRLSHLLELGGVAGQVLLLGPVSLAVLLAGNFRRLAAQPVWPEARLVALVAAVLARVARALGARPAFGSPAITTAAPTTRRSGPIRRPAPSANRARATSASAPFRSSCRMCTGTSCISR